MTDLLQLGIAVAVLTAILQSVTYVLSRAFFAGGGTPLQLLYASTIAMGTASFAGIVALVPASVFFDYRLLGWGLLAAAGFVAGQLCWLRALKLVESSRLASLYNLKIVVVGIFYTLIYRQLPNGFMAAGLVIAVIAAMLMNYRKNRGGFSTSGMGMLAAAILSLACSDIGLVGVLRTMGAPGEPLPVLATACVNIFLSSLLIAPLYRAAGFKPSLFRPALPYTLVCALSIFTVSFAFSILDPVYSNVVLSTRGLFSLLLGAILARFGYTAVEARLSAGQWLLRGAAALLMFAAIAIYSYGKMAGACYIIR